MFGFRVLPRLVVVLGSATLILAGPAWWDGNRGFIPDTTDFYQHQRYGKTAAGGENSDDWEKDGGWCRQTSIMNGLYYWKKKGYAGVLPNGITANNTWLDTFGTELPKLVKTMIDDKKSLADALKAKGHGVDAGVGAGKGLAIMYFFADGTDVKYESSDGADKGKLAGTTLFEAYKDELIDGKQVQIIFHTPNGAGPYSGKLWWKGDKLADGAFHNVTGAGVDVAASTIFFDDPDSNKLANADGDAGIDWKARPDAAVNARKFIAWDGTNDVIPVPNPANAGEFFAAKMKADGVTIDGTVADNARYQNVQIAYLEVIQPAQAVRRPGPLPTSASPASSLPTVSTVNEFDITAGPEMPVDAFWFFPTALVDWGAPVTFSLSDGSSWVPSSSGGTDPEGNVRPYGGVKVEATSGRLDPGEIGQLTFTTLSAFDGYDTMFRDAEAPGVYRVQVYGVPGLVLPAQRCEGVPQITVTRSQISWTGIGAAYSAEVVRGLLSTLAASGGDFTTSTEECLTDENLGTSIAYGTIPAAGVGYWFLVRINNCGTYDTGMASQVASRDSGIAAAVGGCP
jgi:hypothetical protein